MKVMIISIPLRGEPEVFPPFGSLCVLKYLRKNGYSDVSFYNLDFLRPKIEDAIEHIAAAAPDVLGISAVVSTSYAYVKAVVAGVKKRLPGTLVVVGGAMVASAEVLLRKAGCDICVIGEGEQAFLEVCRRAETTRKAADFADIGGLALLDAQGQMVNTGYLPQLANDLIYDIDWQDLAESAELSWYFARAIDQPGKCEPFLQDPRAEAPAQAGKRVGVLLASRGCVARCTFCHRFQKGIRYVPVDILMARVRELVDHHDVGFIRFADENFGTDKRWLAEFCAKMKEVGVLWSVGGMRVNCVTPEYIALMKDAGCTAIIYGMESGSPSMLEVMEKKTTLEDNRNAMKWTVDAGLWTIVQLVLGMPGESAKTVGESADFVAYALTLSPRQRPSDVSINYAQALPGTPLYEFARQTGRIEATLDGEERYLLSISDREAYDRQTSLNFTEFPRFECDLWRPNINLKAYVAYMKAFGPQQYYQMLLETGRDRQMAEFGYFTEPKRTVDRELTNRHLLKPPSLWLLLRQRKFGLAQACYPVLAWRLRFLQPLLLALKLVSSRDPGVWGELRDYVWFKLKTLGRAQTYGYRSLRKIVAEQFRPLPTDTPAMDPLRKGR